MFEKLKDILFDLSDIFVSLLIIAVIFFSVSWKISDTLEVDLTAPFTDTTVEESEDIPVTVIIPEVNASGTEAETAEGSVDTESSDSQTATEDQATTAETTDTSSTEATSTTVADQTLNNFVISDGATGRSIGNKLKQEGYITDVDAFVNQLVALKLDSKLRSGTFKISKADSLDTIIKVLAGKGR